MLDTTNHLQYSSHHTRWLSRVDLAGCWDVSYKHGEAGFNSQTRYMIKNNYSLIAIQEETHLELERTELGRITRKEAVDKAVEFGKQWIDAYSPTTIVVTLVEGDGLGKRDDYEFKYNPHKDTP